MASPSAPSASTSSRRPSPATKVLDASPVYLEPEAGALLDDKLLDADVEGEEVRFALREQT